MVRAQAHRARRAGLAEQDARRLTHVIMHATRSITSWSDSARFAWRVAESESEALGHEYLGTDAILIGIAESTAMAAQLLAARGASAVKVRQIVQELYAGTEQEVCHPALPPGQFVVLAAIQEARKLHQRVVGSEHLVLAILKNGKCRASAVLSALGVDETDLRLEILVRMLDLSTASMARPNAKSFEEHPDVREFYRRIGDLQTEFEEAVAGMDFEKAARLRGEQKAKEAEFAELLTKLVVAASETSRYGVTRVKFAIATGPPPVNDEGRSPQRVTGLVQPSPCTRHSRTSP
jgi:hypothetical protein